MASKREMLDFLEAVYAELGELLGYELPDGHGDDEDEDDKGN